jgi:hypothetical protein
MERRSIIRKTYLYIKENASLKKAAPDNDQGINLGDFIKNAILALGIYLFFCGWIYLYIYLGAFGISINDLNLPIWSYYIYGFQVLITWFVCIPGLVVQYHHPIFTLLVSTETQKNSPHTNDNQSRTMFS